MKYTINIDEAVTRICGKVFAGYTSKDKLTRVCREIVRAESGDRIDPKNPNSSAKGLMQIIGSTPIKAAYMDDRGVIDYAAVRRAASDIRNPEVNLDVGIRYFRYFYMLYKNYPDDLRIASSIGSYMLGESMVKKALRDTSATTWQVMVNGLPYKYGANYPQNYVKGIMAKASIAPGTDNSSIFKSNGSSTTIMPDRDAISSINLKPIVGKNTEYIQAIAVEDAPPEDNAPDFFKLGDIVLRVPPQNISIQESNSIRSIDTVRTKGSPKMNSGATQMSISVQCTFPSVPDINGYFDESGYWHGGLRGILAEYFRTPFVPLENDTIRAMVYPKGFTPYERSKDYESFDRSYQDAITSLQAVEADVKNSGGDTAAIKKMITSYTNLRKDANTLYQQSLDKNTNPLADSVANSEEKVMETETNPRYRDRQLAVVLDSFSISTVPGYPESINLTMTLLPYNFDPFSTTFSFLHTDDDAVTQCIDYTLLNNDPYYNPTDLVSTMNASSSIPFKKYYRALLQEWQDAEEGSPYNVAGQTVYKMRADERKGLIGKYRADPTSPIKFKYHYSNANRLSLLATSTALLQMQMRNRATILDALPREELLRETKLWGNYKPTFFYEIALKQLGVWWGFASNGKAIFMKALLRKLSSVSADTGFLTSRLRYWDPFKLRFRDASALIEDLNNQLALSGGKKLTEEDFLEAFSEALDAEVTNESLPVASATIDFGGANIAITGITASYKNKVTPMQLVGHRDPTYQYMGGSDVEFSLNIQTTDMNLVSALRRMALFTSQTQLLLQMKGVSEMGQYIDTSAEVESEFFQMLGVTRVSITDVGYSVDPEHPGLMNITMRCVQSDFDLMRYEAIVAQKTVTPQLVQSTMEILRAAGKPRAEGVPDLRTWAPNSLWEKYSQAAYRIYGDSMISEFEKDLLGDPAGEGRVGGKIGDAVEQGVKAANGLRDGIMMAIGAITNPMKISEAAQHTIESDKTMAEGESAIDTLKTAVELHQEVAAALRNPRMLQELGNKKILDKYMENEDKYDATRLVTTAYPDMNLPILQGAVLAPPDFYFKREPIGSTDTVAEELYLLNVGEKYRFLDMLRTAIYDNQAALKSIEDGRWEKLLLDLGQLDDLNPWEDPNEETANKIDNMIRDITSELGLTTGTNTPATVAEAAQMAIAVINAAAAKKMYAQVDKRAKTKMSGLDMSKTSSDGTSGHEGKKMLEDSMTGDLNILKRAMLGYSHKLMWGTDPGGTVDQTQYAEASMKQYGLLTIGGEAQRAVMQARALDSRRTGQMLQMSRAFPTFKLYFIEEDNEQWLLFDDFYGYSAVKSIDIIKTRKAASDAAVVRVSNVTSVLSNPMGDYLGERTVADGTSDEQKLDKMMLRVGCAVMIKMGYTNDPTELETVFYGAIAELRPGNGEIEFVAQGWGASLNNPLPIAGKGESIGAWDWRKAHGDIVSWGLGHIGMKHMGGASIFEDTDDILRTSPGAAMYTGFLRRLTGIDIGNNNTRDDNVYLPYHESWWNLAKPTFDWRIDGGTTVWALIQEILLWYPGWIATVLPYETHVGSLEQHRSTLYIGPRDGFYKYTDDYEDDWLQFQANVRRGDTVAYTGETEIVSSNSKMEGFEGLADLSGPIGEYADKVSKMLETVYSDGNIIDVASVVNLIYTGAAPPKTFKDAIDVVFNSKKGYHYAPDRMKNPDARSNSELYSYLSGIKGNIPLNISCAEFASIVSSLASYYGMTPQVIVVAKNGKKGKDGASHSETHLIPVAFTNNAILRNGKVHAIMNSRSELDAEVINLNLGAGKREYNQGVAWVMVDPKESNQQGVTYYTRKDIMLEYIKTMGKYYDLRDAASIFSSIKTAEWHPGSWRGIDSKMKEMGEPQVPKGSTGLGSIDPSKRENFFDADGRLLRCFRPVSRYHFLDSYHHIMDNSIVASVDGNEGSSFCNKVIMTYPDGGGTWAAEPIMSYQKTKFTGLYEVQADDDIDIDYIRPYYVEVKNIDGNFISNAWLPWMIGKDTNQSEEQKNAAVPMYIKVGNNILAKQVSEMYDGSITIVGDPSIKPWDTCYIYDFENSMNGPVQVEQVIHHFSEETGFVTVITPDLIVHSNNLADSFDTSYMAAMIPKMLWNGLKSAFLGTGGQAMTIGKVLPGISSRVISRSSRATLATLGIERGIMKGATKLIGQGGTRAAVKFIPVAGWIIAAGWTLKDFTSGIGLTMKKELGTMLGRQPITITPLMVGGEPFVAGLEGMRMDNIYVCTKDKLTSLRQFPDRWLQSKLK